MVLEKTKGKFMFDLLKILEVGDELEIQITGASGNYVAKIVEFDNCEPRHPRLVTKNSEGIFKSLVLKDGDYIIKRVLTKDKCVLCKKETPYAKDAHINGRVFYVEGCGQLCSDCYQKTASF